jgi:hypothetical protein
MAGTTRWGPEPLDVLSLMLMPGGVAARIVARKPRRRPVAG